MKRLWCLLKVKFGFACAHTIDKDYWRPAQIEDTHLARMMGLTPGAGRSCDKCGLVESLTGGEYYAQFTRVFPRTKPAVRG